MKNKTVFIPLVAALLTAAFVAGCAKHETAPDAHAHDGAGAKAGQPAAAESDIEYYTCPMHPSVKTLNSKDTCPICKMDLTPVKKRKAGAEGEAVAAPIVDIGLARLQQIGAKTDAVMKQDLSRAVTATGMVKYDESKLSDINVRVGGWIQKLFVDRTGQWVRKGDLLFTLYSPELLAAQRDFLIAVETANKLNDPAMRAAARERMRLWDIPELDLEEIEKSGEPRVHFTFRAPQSGFVIEKMVLAGQKVEPGMTLYKLADLSTVWVEADFYESEMRFLKEGDFVEIQFAGLPNKDYLGTIDYIYPYIENETRTQRIRVTLENPGHLLKPAMYARLTVDVDLGEKLAVPVEAVMPTGHQYLVFVHRGEGRIEPRFVKVGARSGNYY